jgi:hypothetical protein
VLYVFFCLTSLLGLSLMIGTSWYHTSFACMFVHFTSMLLLSLLFANYNLLCKSPNCISNNYLIVTLASDSLSN